MTQDQTYWNGEPCRARRVMVLVADAPQFPQYWARSLVGQSREAVEVRPMTPLNAPALGANPDQGEVFYLDDHDGSGWTKVTDGRGSPGLPHRSLAVKSVLEDRDAPVRAPGRDGTDAPGVH